MEKQLLIFLIALGSSTIQGQTTLTCQTCTWPMDGDDCFTGNTTGLFSCGLQDRLNPYCQTQFVISGGMVTSIVRSCHAGATDSDTSSDFMPASDKCDSLVLKNNNIVENSCYFSCNLTDNCNSASPDSLMFCSQECQNGQCDYITGTCVCDTNWIGEACDTGAPPPADPQRMSCVQCSDETDSSCRTKQDGVACRSPDSKFCSTIRATTFNKDGNQISEMVTKACANEYVASDECFISPDQNWATEYMEYTCISTCDTNNCNQKIPDGRIGNNEVLQPIFCKQCSDNTDSLCGKNTKATVCPATAKYCFSTSTYYLSEKMDKNLPVEPDIQVISITRGCASDAVSSSCSRENVDGTSLQRVICSETCSSDNCNEGWPARPKCSQCSLGTECAVSPNQPESCPLPHQSYCVLQDINVNTQKTGILEVSGYQRLAFRGCSYNGIGNDCAINQYGRSTTENCNKTCTTNGCNLGVLGSGAATIQLHKMMTSLTAFAMYFFLQ